MLVTLTLPEYEQVRANPRRFVMIRGHELAEVERIVAGTPAYVIVEKTGEEGERARADDPRSE
jgi:hypothetical protein